MNVNRSTPQNAPQPARIRPTALLAAICFATAASAQTITSVGSLGPDANNIDASYAFGVNFDGNAVVGRTTTPAGDRAFYWTPAGMQNLGVLPGGTYSYATGVSADGLWIVGFGSTPSGDRAFRALLNNPLTDLGAGGLFSAANAVSADGSAVAGGGFTFAGSFIFRWTTTGGVQGIGSSFLGIGAIGISGDGGTVVGYSSGILTDAAIQWTPAGGMVGLAPLTGGNRSFARGASYDGSFICGDSNTTADNLVHAVRWYAGTPQDIGVLPGYSSSQATAIHASGLALAGECVSGLADDAWIWTEPRGMTPLANYLASEGVNLTGWSAFHSCTAISADGTALVGTGTYQGQIRGFVARGLPPICGPWITEHPASNSTCQDGTASLAVTAYGPSFHLPSVQWQRFDGTNWVNVVDGTTGFGTNISGANSYVLTFSSCNTDVAGYYRAQITAGCAIRNSLPALFSVNSMGANIIFQPVNTDACPDGSAGFTFTQLNFSTDAPFYFQWQREAAPNVFVPLPDGTTTVWDGNVAGSGGIVSGANTGVLTIAADTPNGRTLSDAQHGVRYRCVVTNGCAAVPTDPAGLKIWSSCDTADINGDNDVDFFDIDPFLLALFNPTAYAEAYPDVHPLNADCNHDGTVDFFDIDAFLQCLFAECP